VKTYPQRRQPAGARHRVRRRRAADHQACRVENALAVGFFDGLVDGQRRTEVIAGNDEPPQE
jgi:hypothetical protein